MLGREVATLVDGVKPQGANAVAWNASGNASGVYIYKLIAGEYSAMKKLTLVK